MQTLDIGEAATIHTAWYDKNGVAAEPASILLVITKPDGTTITKTKADMAEIAVDKYDYSTIADVAGLWRYTVEGTIAGGLTKLPSGTFLAGVESRDGPCEAWCSWQDVLACASGLDAVTTRAAENAIDYATDILWKLTRRRYSGVCVVTRSLCLSCRTCYPRVCSCEPLNGIDLGIASPIHAIWDVWVDGVMLDPSVYGIVDRKWLVRNDNQVWPTGTLNNNELADPHAFSATWAYGRPIPKGARNAAALLAAELAKACLGQVCQIPQHVSTVTREGITYQIVDVNAIIAEGSTGVALVDQWLAADRIGRRPRAHIFVPGAPRTTRLH